MTRPIDEQSKRELRCADYPRCYVCGFSIVSIFDIETSTVHCSNCGNVQHKCPATVEQIAQLRHDKEKWRCDSIEGHRQVQAARERIAELEAENARMRGEPGKWLTMAQALDKARRRIAELEERLRKAHGKHECPGESECSVCQGELPIRMGSLGLCLDHGERDSLAEGDNECAFCRIEELEIRLVEEHEGSLGREEALDWKVRAAENEAAVARRRIADLEAIVSGKTMHDAHAEGRRKALEEAVDAVSDIGRPLPEGAQRNVAVDCLKAVHKLIEEG